LNVPVAVTLPFKKLHDDVSRIEGSWPSDDSWVLTAIVRSRGLPAVVVAVSEVGVVVVGTVVEVTVVVVLTAAVLALHPANPTTETTTPTTKMRPCIPLFNHACLPSPLNHYSALR
jgi:hypothetical protein